VPVRRGSPQDIPEHAVGVRMEESQLAGTVAVVVRRHPGKCLLMSVQMRGVMKLDLCSTSCALDEYRMGLDQAWLKLIARREVFLRVQSQAWSPSKGQPRPPRGISQVDLRRFSADRSLSLHALQWCCRRVEPLSTPSMINLAKLLAYQVSMEGACSNLLVILHRVANARCGIFATLCGRLVCRRSVYTTIFPSGRKRKHKPILPRHIIQRLSTTRSFITQKP